MINEFDKGKTFYKTIGAEENIRLAAQNFQNAYYVVIFACCREILLRSRHTGGMSKIEVEELLERERLRAKQSMEILVRQMYKSVEVLIKKTKKKLE